MSVIIITGTTASGKTAYALKKAQEMDGEIINCDSRQIYAEQDIVTGKDITDHNYIEHESIHNYSIGYYTLEGTTKIWLYDIVKPNQQFSSYDYQISALPVLKNILKRNKTAIICGGTYFYLQHLLYSIGTETIKPDWQLRRKLGNKSTDELKTILSEKNSSLFESLNQSDKNNPQRLIRKIEIAFSGKKISVSNNFDKSVLSEKLSIPDLNYRIIGLKHKNSEITEELIKKRVEERLAKGAVEETRALLTKYGENAPGLKTIGYVQLIGYIKNHMSLEMAAAEWILKEKQYVKRQLTFMKKNPNIEWQLTG